MKYIKTFLYICFNTLISLIIFGLCVFWVVLPFYVEGNGEVTKWWEALWLAFQLISLIGIFGTILTYRNDDDDDDDESGGTNGKPPPINNVGTFGGAAGI